MAAPLANTACRACTGPTNLPYLCRECWTALGYAGQITFYQGVQRLSSSHPYAWLKLVRHAQAVA